MHNCVGLMHTALFEASSSQTGGVKLTVEREKYTISNKM